VTQDKRSGDAQTYLELPELGVIPLMTPRSPGKSLTVTQPHRSTRNSTPGAIEAPLSDCPELATWTRQPSLVAEMRPHPLVHSFAYPGWTVLRSLSSQVQARATASKVSCNLSIAMTEIGRRLC